MEKILLGDTVKCPKCGEMVTATVYKSSNLTVLIGSKLCTDGSVKHEWPKESDERG